MVRAGAVKLLIFTKLSLHVLALLLRAVFKFTATPAAQQSWTIDFLDALACLLLSLAGISCVLLIIIAVVAAQQMS
jgi:hypothetical protein